MEMDIPAEILVELNELEDQLDLTIPAKHLDRNVLIATWNIRAFGDLTRKWASEEEDSPRRDKHSLQIITRIIRRFDVIAIQEVKSNIRALRDMLKLLGENWSFILTDVTEGNAGNGERMAFIFDTRRIKLSGLACELVVPKERLNAIGEEALREQFARTPYAVSFRSESTTFILVTLHILYGKRAKDRIPELKAIADWMADWASDVNAYDQNLIALGDFNVDERGDLLHNSFISSGLFIPKDLAEVTRSIFDTEKFYDHIAWFIGRRGVPDLSMKYVKGGNFDFIPFVFKNRQLSKIQTSWMVSDHYPLWAEFSTR
ncbi:MAG: deoxyribonuclease [Saprospiraceae bacterium]|nr:MAG: deoxyribonuclease [Saprospiraceae bacterium]